ncbi:endonuclease Q family protein [Aquibacillus kalidii]|uniref:endonuclease Q family protein n=1 Tax=Aquibacillus kalidii TaxID=2762597 RepID=UPI001647499C|nr:PHP-associated domain-containing protein [Aquibacillus kalidii]
MTLAPYYVDLHIHIGRDKDNKPVKITGSKTLTLTNVLKESSRNKGIDMVGIIDCHVPSVQDEIENLISKGEAVPLEEGGIKFEKVTLLLGCEIEIYDENCHGPIHVLCFLPTLSQMKEFTSWLSDRMTNINLSSQRIYGTAKELQYKVKQLEGLFIPAHVFTPFKSLYGKGVKQSLTEVLDPDLIDAIELGLSADTKMADCLSELHSYTYVTNSDAHSLAKIAREYQKIQMNTPSFKELEWALHGIEGRQVLENFGLNPLLGKYHVTVCKECLTPKKEKRVCDNCDSNKVIKGVSDRIAELANGTKTATNRPRYTNQVPLDYIPTLGPKTFEKLLSNFGTEMNIIHNVSKSELKNVVSEQIASSIIAMREGSLNLTPGGGGKYGKVGKS